MNPKELRGLCAKSASAHSPSSNSDIFNKKLFGSTEKFIDQVINLTDEENSSQSFDSNSSLIDQQIPLSHYLSTASLSNNTTIIIVNTLTDEVNNNDLTSLREAFLEAKDNPNIHYEIVLEGGQTYELSREGRNEDLGLEGDIDVYGSVTLRSNNSEKAIINANSLDRVFQIHPGANFQGENLLLTGGDGTPNNDFGGAFYVYESNLTLTNSEVKNNRAKNGGGIYLGGK